MSAGNTATPRRPRADRPKTVPLSEFGKEPPPPPRVRLTPRQIAISAAATLATLVVIWIGLAMVESQNKTLWGRSGCKVNAQSQC